MSDIWTTLAARGRIATINIGRPRARVPLTLFVDEITKRRSPDEVLPDLGVATRNDKQRSAVEEYIKVGYKLLLPQRYEKQWRSIETSARRTILQDAGATGNGYIYAFSTPFGPFIPVDNMQKWIDRISEYHDRYMDVARDLVRDYDDVRREVIENFESIAKMTYTNLNKEDPALLRGVLLTDFVRRYVRVAKEAMPTPKEIMDQTYFNWALREVTVPDDDRKRVIADAAFSPDEKDRIKTLNGVIAMVLKANRNDLLQLESDVNRQLFSVIFNASEMALHYLGEGGLPPKMSLMLDKLVEQVRGLNVLDYPEVVKWAEDMRDAVLDLRGAKASEKDDARDDLRAAAQKARDGAARRLQKVGGALRSEMVA